MVLVPTMAKEEEDGIVLPVVQVQELDGTTELDWLKLPSGALQLGL
jgi:hypothetical protein